MMRGMTIARLLAAATLLVAAAPAPVPTPPPAPSPGEIVAAAPASDWVAIAASDVLVMTLAPDARGKPRRVIIQLMLPPFSQGWIGNIRRLAAAHWWDGTSVNRVQDNYVVQWGDADAEDKAKAKPLPAGIRKVLEINYIVPLRTTGAPPYPPPWSEMLSRVFVDDTYGRSAVWWGWPVAMDTKTYWPVHCYGMVGVGRDLSPDTGSGAELYAVIGHAPRHLDRNIALVGRVVEGIDHLSSLPRGTEALGFYKTPGERTPIVSIRLASELAVAERPLFEFLSTESATFARYADARANRRDSFFIRPAGGADICNIPVPVRRVRR